MEFIISIYTTSAKLYSHYNINLTYLLFMYYTYRHYFTPVFAYTKTNYV